MEIMMEKELVLVDCVSTFRMRYLVEVPVGKSEWALDTVTMNEAKEFSQEWIGEQILSHRVVSDKEALAVCDVDNEYCKTWTDEKKLEVFVTSWKDPSTSDLSLDSLADEEIEHTEQYYDTERNK
jgi:predicted RNA-binding protein